MAPFYDSSESHEYANEADGDIPRPAPSLGTLLPRLLIKMGTTLCLQ